MDRKWHVRFRQFNRGRRSDHVITVSAESRTEARIHFQKTVNLAKILQRFTPFIVDHISIVSIFECKEG